LLLLAGKIFVSDLHYKRLKEALQRACEIASTHKTVIILPMDWHEDYMD